MAPLFSIVIPVYNTVRELERCVNSITMQKYSDFEVILVDDGSTDGSGELCDRLSGQDDRIRTIHKQNGGCSEARNTGIRAARGEYLMFVDSDDMWDDENALGDIAAIIAEQKQVDVVCFGVAIYNEDGSLVKIRKPTLPEHGGQSKTELLRHLVYTNQYFSASYVKVLSRRLVFEKDLFFVGGLLSGEDEVALILEKGTVIPAKSKEVLFMNTQSCQDKISSSIYQWPGDPDDDLRNSKGVIVVDEKECTKVKSLSFNNKYRTCKGKQTLAMIFKLDVGGTLEVICKDKNHNTVLASESYTVYGGND